MIHKSGDFLGAVLAFQHERIKRVQKIAVFAVYLIQSVNKGLSLRLVPCRHLADEHGGNNTVLITGICAYKIAV